MQKLLRGQAFHDINSYLRPKSPCVPACPLELTRDNVACVMQKSDWDSMGCWRSLAPSGSPCSLLCRKCQLSKSVNKRAHPPVFCVKYQKQKMRGREMVDSSRTGLHFSRPSTYAQTRLLYSQLTAPLLQTRILVQGRHYSDWGNVQLY